MENSVIFVSQKTLSFICLSVALNCFQIRVLRNISPGHIPLLPPAVIQNFYWHHYIKQVEGEIQWWKTDLGWKTKPVLAWPPSKISVCRQDKNENYNRRNSLHLKDTLNLQLIIFTITWAISERKSSSWRNTLFEASNTDFFLQYSSRIFILFHICIARP